MKLMKKINKEFDEKCIKIRNRIQRLKNEEAECLKQRINFKKKEKHNKQIREDKIKLKNKINKLKEDKCKDLILKKNFVQSQRMKSNENRENKKKEIVSKKKSKYQSLLNEKHLMKIIREQLNTLQMNKNTYSHAKIKQELNEYEANRMKRNLEKQNMNKKIHEQNIMQLKLLEEEMKITCNQLEELEKQAVDRLKRTKYVNLRLFSEDKTKNNFKKVKKNKLNQNKHLNKSMENIKVNGINEHHNKSFEEKEDVYSNKSNIIIKSSLMSPKYRNKDITLKISNKKQKDLSSSAFSKTNKEKNSQKINLKLANGSIKNNIKDKNEKKSIKYIVKSNKSFDKK